MKRYSTNANKEIGLKKLFRETGDYNIISIGPQLVFDELT